MKLIYFFLMLPVFILAPLVGLMTLFVYYFGGSSGGGSSETLYHVTMLALHLCNALILIGGGILLIYSFIMCILGFVIKSWFRAAVAGAIAFGMGYCVWYVNSITL